VSLWIAVAFTLTQQQTDVSLPVAQARDLRVQAADVLASRPEEKDALSDNGGRMQRQVPSNSPNLIGTGAAQADNNQPRSGCGSRRGGADFRSYRRETGVRKELYACYASAKPTLYHGLCAGEL
jgi:hypothetical protein